MAPHLLQGLLVETSSSLETSVLCLQLDEEGTDRPQKPLAIMTSQSTLLWAWLLHFGAEEWVSVL